MTALLAGLTAKVATADAAAGFHNHCVHAEHYSALATAARARRYAALGREPNADPRWPSVASYEADEARAAAVALATESTLAQECRGPCYIDPRPPPYWTGDSARGVLPPADGKRVR